MDVSRMIGEMKRHPAYHQMGMIATHMGVVRETSLDGRKVKSVQVTFHHDILQKIRDEGKKLPGIVEVFIETRDGVLNVGDEIMVVMVGGDTREHVFPALVDIVDQIKRQGAAKQEAF